jgi:hypothetical protein
MRQILEESRTFSVKVTQADQRRTLVAHALSVCSCQIHQRMRLGSERTFFLGIVHGRMDGRSAFGDLRLSQTVSDSASLQISVLVLYTRQSTFGSADFTQNIPDPLF